MTRLTTDEIKGIARQLDAYDMEIFQKTGCTLRGIACHTFGIPEETFQSIASSVEVGVVPFQCGQGIIEGFSKTIMKIVRHIGFKAFVTRSTDVAGIAEAIEKNAEVIMMADDRRFVALNVKSNRMADNAIATGKGYVAGLDLMAGGLEGQKVLIIGCGAVGQSAAEAVLQRNAEASVYDINLNSSHKVANAIYKAMRKKINIETHLNTALQEYHLLVEASNAPKLIAAEYIRPYTHVVAPGIPLGLTPAAVEKISHRLLHDPLQTGVAVMIVDAVLSRSVEDWRVMLPYGAYIAQVANPQKKSSKKQKQQKTPKDPEYMGTTKETPPESIPANPKHIPPPPPEDPEEDKHERTEVL